MNRLYEQACVLIQKLIGQRHTVDLTDAEVLELVQRAAQTVAQESSRQR